MSSGKFVLHRLAQNKPYCLDRGVLNLTVCNRRLSMRVIAVEAPWGWWTLPDDIKCVLCAKPGRRNPRRPKEKAHG